MCGTTPNSRMVSRENKISLILGIDPGSRVTGFGLIGLKGPSDLVCVDAGLIRPPGGWPVPRRLMAIYDGLCKVINDTRPDEVAVEDIFFARSARAAIGLGQARGVALLAAAKADLPVSIYAPTAIKKALVGYGRASKDQVGHMVRSMLNLNRPLALDATDALACAICHFHTSATARRVAEGSS